MSPNEEVIRRVNKQREPFNEVKKRKTAYQGNIRRNETQRFLHLLSESKIEGKRGMRMEKTTWFRNVRQWTELLDI